MDISRIRQDYSAHAKIQDENIRILNPSYSIFIQDIYLYLESNPIRSHPLIPQFQRFLHKWKNLTEEIQLKIMNHASYLQNEDTIKNNCQIVEKACKLNYMIGVCHRDEIGLMENEFEAGKYLDLSADMQYLLGEYYINIHRVKKNEKTARKAVKLFELAANQKHKAALCSLSYCFHRGWGVKSSFNMAAELLKMSAELNYPKALYNMGIYYEQGLGMSQDKEMAVLYYKRALEKKYFRASYKLGMCYQNGCGVSINYRQAIEYYENAAAEEWGSAANKRIKKCIELERIEWVQKWSFLED